MTSNGVVGRLVVVSTPIGNLGDSSTRMRDALSAVHVIACEDTRHTRLLLERYAIRAPTISYHEHNERHRAVELTQRLRAGQSVALVTDAGTPAVSDPGYRLIRAAIDAGVRVEWVPGPSAVLGALVLSGLPVHTFTFVGFLPVKSAQRTKQLEQLKTEERTVVAFESPHRLLKTLDALDRVYGDGPVAVCRELTKMHEDVQRGTAAQLREHFTAQPPKGEITLVFAPHPERP